jgi:hypothetical protein
MKVNKNENEEDGGIMHTVWHGGSHDRAGNDEDSGELHFASWTVWQLFGKLC